MTKSKYIGTWDTIKGKNGKAMQHQHVIVSVDGKKVFTACGRVGEKFIGRQVYSNYQRCEYCRFKG